MAELSGFPYFEVQLTKDGAVNDPAEAQKVVDFAGGGGVTDLFVISHGWNNDMDEARSLYAGFFARVREEVDAARVAGIAGRKLAVLGLLWPSKKLAEKDLIPSGAASIGGLVTTDDLQGEIDRFGDDLGPEALARAKVLAAKVEDSPAAQDELVTLLRSLLPQSIEGEEAPKELLTLPGRNALAELSKPVFTPPAGGPGGGLGGAAGLGTGAPMGGPSGGAAGLGLLSGIKGGVYKLLNLTTFYQMKERAGKVGLNGVSTVLRQLRATRPDLKLHLIGHSFGGRLVTAAALGPDGQPPVKPDTLTVLQGAFSHYGFSEAYQPGKDGFFRRVVSESRVAGPILISCTQNDQVNGKAYPIVSQLARQAGAALGDKDSLYGGLGANGAQKTPGAQDGTLLPPGGAYQFEKGGLYNLNADTVIQGHSDICKNEVAHALLTAVATV